MILSFGGIPLLYYGDEIGTLNDDSYKWDKNKVDDTRWIHRPQIDWESAELRHQHGTVINRIFCGLQKLIAVRKSIPAFADFNNRELIEVNNEHLFVFLRNHPERLREEVLVIANFDASPQSMNLSALGNRGQFELSRTL
jgi:amylosucrase